MAYCVCQTCLEVMKANAPRSVEIQYKRRGNSVRVKQFVTGENWSDDDRRLSCFRMSPQAQAVGSVLG